MPRFSEVPEVLARARQAGLSVAVCSNLAQAYGDVKVFCGFGRA